MFNLLFLLFFSVCLMDAAESVMNNINLKKAYKHINSFKLANHGQKISGFHHYTFKDSIKRSDYNINIINKNHWVIVPNKFKSDECHGGFIIYNGKNLGWKSFFPCNWNIEKLSKFIKKAFKEKKFEKIDENTQVFSTTVYRLDTEPKCRIIINGKKSYKYVKTAYPEITEIEIENIQDIVNLQKENLEFVPQEIKSNALEHAIQTDDRDTIIETINATPENFKYLNDLLRLSITNRKPEFVEVAILSGAKLADEHLKLTLKQTFSDNDNEDNQAEIAHLLLDFGLTINSNNLKQAIKTDNKKLIYLFFNWCVFNNKKDLLLNYQNSHKDLFNVCIENYQTKINNELYTIENDEIDIKDNDKLIVDWLDNQEVNEKELHDYFNNETVIKTLILAIEKKSTRVNYFFKNEKYKKICCNHADKILELALINNDKNIIEFLTSEFKLYIYKILNNWLINDKFNLCLNFLSLFPDFAGNWIFHDIHLLNDDNIFKMLQLFPELKDFKNHDGQQLIDILNSKKFLNSLAFVTKKNQSIEPTIEHTTLDLSSNNKENVINIISQNKLLNELYLMALKIDPNYIDNELNELVTTNNYNNKDLINILAFNLINFLLQKNEFFDYFWSDKIYEIINNFNDKEIYKIIDKTMQHYSAEKINEIREKFEKFYFSNHNNSLTAESLIKHSKNINLFNILDCLIPSQELKFLLSNLKISKKLYKSALLNIKLKYFINMSKKHAKNSVFFNTTIQESPSTAIDEIKALSFAAIIYTIVCSNLIDLKEFNAEFFEKYVFHILSEFIHNDNISNKEFRQFIFKNWYSLKDKKRIEELFQQFNLNFPNAYQKNLLTNKNDSFETTLTTDFTRTELVLMKLKTKLSQFNLHCPPQTLLTIVTIAYITSSILSYKKYLDNDIDLKRLQNENVLSIIALLTVYTLALCGYDQ